VNVIQQVVGWTKKPPRTSGKYLFRPSDECFEAFSHGCYFTAGRSMEACSLAGNGTKHNEEHNEEHNAEL
jgi:hypothetical protein